MTSDEFFADIKKAKNHADNAFYAWYAESFPPVVTADSWVETLCKAAFIAGIIQGHKDMEASAKVEGLDIAIRTLRSINADIKKDNDNAHL